MLNREIANILQEAEQIGWVMEPQAKHILSLAGVQVPRFIYAEEMEKALSHAEEIGYPVVAKIVSPKVMHKSDAGGVIPGIKSEGELKEAFTRLSRIDGFEGVLVEEMVAGVELIIGAKMDWQFGPVVLLGMGGTGVEIYGDTCLRMAPLDERTIQGMAKNLRAHKLLEGYRGAEPIHMGKLTHMMLAFSDLIIDLGDSMESIDLNPVMCTSKRCVAADARFVLKEPLPALDTERGIITT